METLGLRREKGVESKESDEDDWWWGDGGGETRRTPHFAEKEKMSMRKKRNPSFCRDREDVNEEEEGVYWERWKLNNFL